MPLQAWADGELLVLNNLKNLPPSYFIINDIRIKLSRSIYDKKTRSYISSAQIDHVVIWPNWIFCIETKKWKKFKDTYYNPIEQNSRHALVLYIAIKKLLWKDYSIKNLIASNVWIQSSSVDEYAKVLEYNQLKDYILYYKNNKMHLSYEDELEIRDYLLKIKSEQFLYVRKIL
jgi:hypothetical protein